MSFKGVFITLSILLIFGLVGLGAFVWYQANVKKGLDIQVAVPTEIYAGTPFNVEVNVSNNSENVLDDVQLMLELPEDVVFVGSPPDKIIDTKSLGNLGGGSLSQENFNLLVLGGENTIKELKATVSYAPKALGARFEANATADFSVVGPSIDIDIAMPQKIFSGEQFEAVVTYKNVSNRDFEDLELKMSYPASFAFKSASLDPDQGQNIWELGDLRHGSEGKITIKGDLRGADNALFEMQASLEAGFLGRAYKVAERSAGIAISPSPLSLQVSLNNDPAYIAHLGDTLDYRLAYTNNTDVGLKDVIVKAQLIGAMFDLTTLNTRASLRASDNTLIWNAASAPDLATISPGGSGFVEFTVKLKQNYPIAKLSDKNFTLKVLGEIQSPTVPYFVAAEKTVGIANLENKVGGKVTIEAQGYFRDAPSGVLNKGPWPMKVGQATQFTVHWRLVNYSNDIKDVDIKAFLGGNVKLVDVVKSSAASEPSYNDRTQEVSWHIDSIPATKGVLAAPVEAILQVEATPSIADLGSPMVLLQATSLQATDDFSGEILKVSAPIVQTGGLADPTVKFGEGNVTQ